MCVLDTKTYIWFIHHPIGAIGNMVGGETQPYNKPYIWNNELTTLSSK